MYISGMQSIRWGCNCFTLSATLALFLIVFNLLYTILTFVLTSYSFFPGDRGNTLWGYNGTRNYPPGCTVPRQGIDIRLLWCRYAWQTPVYGDRQDISTGSVFPVFFQFVSVCHCSVFLSKSEKGFSCYISYITYIMRDGVPCSNVCSKCISYID